MAAVHLFLLLLLLSLFFLPSFPQSETDTLLKLKKSFTQSESLNNWVPNSPPCAQKWIGVMCSGEVVAGLHLSDMKLAGKIDIEALAQIPGLKTLGLMNNGFTGEIPEFNKLVNLKFLYLSGNKFTGEIPAGYFKPMTNLKKLWIDNNTFTGKIPESVMDLPLLNQLHVEKNQFSGQIPPLKQPEKVNSIDFSNNKLEGQIPESYSKFEAAIFNGNEGLCGKPLQKECDSGHVADDSDSKSSGWGQKVIIAVAILVVMLFFVGAAVFTARGKDYNEKEPKLRSTNQEQAVAVNVPESSRNLPVAASTRKTGDSKKGSTHAGGRGGGTTDLVMVNDEKGAFGMQDLMKAAAEVLGNGGLGSAYKAVMASGLAVVVKRMREMNKLGKEGFESEMRRFGKLRHPNLLTPLAYHFRREEKLMVTEYMPKGSLLYVLHGDRGTIHADLNWPIRRGIIQGIAKGMSFIHSEFSTYEVPHGNLKSSNVILTEKYEPLLSDYGMLPLANPNNVAQALFAYKCPEYVSNQHICPKSDVYCLGILILEIITGKFPSQYLSNGKGGIDVVQWVQTLMSENKEEELIDPEIASDTNSVGQMLQLLKIGASCTETGLEKRLEMKEAIRKILEVESKNTNDTEKG